MNELSLFSGAGGGLLGTTLLGWNHVGYVEYDEYCQKVIAQRIKDGILNEAPIFSNIETFISEGFSESYQGMVDVITAGFPCQPFSVAGKQLGEKDERNMWPATIDIIRLVRPRYALLENVPGLLSNGYFGQVLSDLSKSGYDAKWKVISAAELGAPHKRDRLWVVAYTTGHRGELSNKPRIDEKKVFINRNGKREFMADAPVVSKREQADENEPITKRRSSGNESCIGSEYVSNTDKFNDDLCRHGAGKICRKQSGPPEISRCKITKSNESGCKKFNITAITEKQGLNTRPSTKNRNGEWWTIEPELGRVANGVAHRVDRLKAIGNGQVPAVVRSAWELLS